MKNTGNKNLDQLLKDKLSDGSANVPGFVWDNIEAELFPKKKRRGFFWWIFGGIGLFLLITFIAIGSYGRKLSPQQNAENINRSSVISGSKHAAKNSSSALAENNSKTTSNADQGSVSNFQKKNLKPADLSGDGSASRNAVNNGSAEKKGSVSGKVKSQRTRSTGKKTGKTTNGSKSPGKVPASPGIKGSNSVLAGISAAPGASSGNERTLPGNNANTAEPEKDPQSAKKPNVDTLPYLMADLNNEEQNPVDWKKPPEPPKKSFFSVIVYGGPSFYDIAVFKDYFTSGQLSNRSFSSSGFEAGAQADFKLGDKFSVYTGLAFNRKQSMFQYNLAVTTEDYFGLVVNDEKVPLANISDDGTNSCFIAEGAGASYAINTVMLSAGGRYEFLRFGKFSAAADLRLSMNIRSAMNLKETQVIDIPAPDSEKFSYFQPGVGILMSYDISDRISLGLSPFYSKQFGAKDNSFYRKLNELVVPVTIRIKF